MNIEPTPPLADPHPAGGNRLLFAVPLTLREANDFVAQFHRHNGRTARDGGKFALGASTGNEQAFGKGLATGLRSTKISLADAAGAGFGKSKQEIR